jgi:deaminated glutathione amidase
MKVAAVQMTSGTDVARNLASARELLERAAAQGARVAALPENFALMGRGAADRRAVAEAPGDGPIQAFLSDSARRLGLWIIGGTIPLKVPDEPRPAAACLVFDDAGECSGRYDKMHLFDVDVPGGSESHRESSNIAPGHRPVLLDTPAGQLGLAVCYDVRFPELFRHLSAQGATWFVLPSAFTVPTGQAHWEMLLRARAIENLAYLVAPAQWGRHDNGRATYGDSLIVDYWGRVLGRLPQGAGVVIASFDAAGQSAARSSFPALAHRVM